MRKPPAHPRPRHRVGPARPVIAAAAVLALGGLGVMGAPGVPGTGGVAHAENAGSEELEFNPETVSPGQEVTVNTTVCGAGRAGTGNASSLGVAEFTMETATHKEVLVGKVTVPSHTVEGEYEISVTCADGAKSATGVLWVTAGAPDIGPTSPSTSWNSTPATPSHPAGHVRTGVGGGTSGPGTPQIAAGAAVLAAAAVGGSWLLLRRRARETQQRS